MQQQSNKLSRFWQELKRRRVIQVIIVYATAAYVIIELVNNVYETLNLPDWTPALTLIILVVGFPIAVIFAWIYDLTVKGIKKTEPIEDTAEENEVHSIKDKPVLPEKSIIVLPFENISPDPDQEYFSDGLTEEIITDLSHIHDFLVISRSSAMTFKDSKKKIREIANEVNVKYVLEGSVRKSGNNLRITGQLIDAASDTHIWAKKYSGTLEDIFDIQEKVSSSIANELKIKISSEEKKKIQERPIDNVFAYDCYLRAYREIMSWTNERVELGLELLQKGNELAGENAIIYAGMAFAYFQYANLGYEREKHIKKAEEYTKKALFIDPGLAEAHTVYANILLVFSGNIHKAISHFNMALKNKPDNPEILVWLWWCYHLIGKTDAAITLVYGQNEQAIIEYDKAIKFNPNDWRAYNEKGNMYIDDDLVKAIDNLQKAASINRGPELPGILKQISYAYIDAGFPEKAVYFYQEALKLDGDSLDYYFLVSRTERYLGNFNKAIELLKIGYDIDTNYVHTLLQLGDNYLFIGEYEESLKYYEKWVEKITDLGRLNRIRMGWIGFVYWQNGYQEKAEYYFNEQIKYCNRINELGREFESELWTYYYLADVYAFRGEKDKVYENLRIFNQRQRMTIRMVNRIKNHPLFDSMRDELEFQQIVKDMEAKYQAEHERVRQWLEENEML